MNSPLASISRDRTRSEIEALDEVRLRLGSDILPLRTDEAAREQIELDWQDIGKLNLEYPAGRLDAGRLSLVIDYDVHLTGIPLRFYSPEPGRLVVEDQWLRQLAGQRFVGESSLVLTYKQQPVGGRVLPFRFRVDAIIVQQWDWIRRELQQENEMVLDFYGLAREHVAWQSESTSDLPSDNERFALLSWLFGKLQPLLRLLSVRPTENLAAMERLEPIAQARQIYYPGFARVPSERLEWRHRAYSNQIVPATVPVRQIIINCDTVENRYLRAFLRRLLREARDLYNALTLEYQRLSAERQELRAEWGEMTDFQLLRTRSACRLLLDIRDTLVGYLTDGFLAEVGDSEVVATSHVMRLHPLYRQVWSLAHELERGLVISQSLIPVQGLSLRTRSINSLYEIWVVLVILRNLEALGFEPVAENGKGLAKAGFNRALRPGAALELRHPQGVRLVARYSYSYPALAQSGNLVGVAPAMINGQSEMKNQPDLALEFYLPGEQIPRMVTVDATYSQNPVILSRKGIYASTIRSREWLGQRPEEWDYPVEEAWAAYPATHITPEKEVRRMHTGEFGLIPGDQAEARVFTWLQGILRRLNLSV